MTIFNFTVRATDDLGAFSDRNFSINVRNTVVERFVASTNEGHLLTSVDAVNWTYRHNLLTTPSSVTVAFGNVINGNGFWLVTKSQNTYLYSKDAINWVEYSFPAGYFLVSYTSNKSEFAYGDGKIAILMSSSATTSNSSGNTTVVMATTENGIDWTLSNPIGTNLNNGRFTRLAYGDGRWITNHFGIVSGTLGPTNKPIVGYTTTNNGETWAPVYTFGYGNNDNIPRTSPMFFNGLWLMFQRTTAASYYLTSNDGVVWNTTQYPSNSAFPYMFNRILYGNGLLVAYPDATTSAGSAFDMAVFTSTNGTTWDKTTLTEANSLLNGTVTGTAYYSFGTTTSTQGYITGVYHNGKYIFATQSTVTAVGTAGNENSGGMISSTDGINWSKINIMNAAGTSSKVSIQGLAALRQ